MRKLLWTTLWLAILIALLCVWLFQGRQLVRLLDRVRTVQTSSHAIEKISYEGNGSGGILHLDDKDLSLNEVVSGVAQPHVGTTKDGNLALSSGGNVFSFGPVQPGADTLATTVQAGDQATIEIRRSVVGWPTFFEVNFMTGNSTTWRRNLYLHLTWRKQNGAELEMVWHYEQYYYPQDRWTEALMSREGATGLTRTRISPDTR